jgi:hypothetical protein
MAKLITMLPIEPFVKWGLEFIGPIKPLSRSHNKYILVAIEYAQSEWM